MSSQNQYLTVSKFNLRVKRFLEKQDDFKEVHIKGEVTEISNNSSGHIYFSLKDRNSLVECVIYQWNRKNIGFKIKNGMKLFVIANVIFYRPKAKFELDIVEAVEDGVGQLYVKFKQLKEKLLNEGLFSEEHKKALPEFAKSIGVITSKDGKAIRDILRNINQNWPFCDVILFPSLVQGSAASKQLTRQVKLADSYGLDVLIIGRGGGSIEDLWCFNDEALVRTIFNINTPIISAFGHESDDTLCDLVSDVSASTPTMAASLAVNNKDEISSTVNNYNHRLITFMSSRLNNHKREFNYILSKQLFTDASYIYSSKKDDFTDLKNRFKYSSGEFVSSRRNMLTKIKSSYVIRHPLKMQVDSSTHKLNELQSHLIKSMNNIIKTNRYNLDKSTKYFKFLSDKLMQSKKYNLMNIKSSYVIQNPCRIQLNHSLTNLNSSKQSIVNFTRQNINSNKNDFSKLTSRFKYSSNEIISSKRSTLNKIKSSYVFRNPCKIQFGVAKINLDNAEVSIVDETLSIIKTNRINLDNIVSEFKFSSNKIISNENYRLNKIKSSYAIQNPLKIQLTGAKNDLASSKEDIIKLTNKKVKSSNADFINILNNNVLKNPHIILNKKTENLNKIKDEKIIKNPYLILNEYEQKLTFIKDKLDKQEEILKLQKDKEKQKSMYIKIIIAIIIILIIMLLIIIGGI